MTTEMYTIVTGDSRYRMTWHTDKFNGLAPHESFKVAVPLEEGEALKPLRQFGSRSIRRGEVQLMPHRTKRYSPDDPERPIIRGSDDVNENWYNLIGFLLPDALYEEPNDIFGILGKREGMWIDEFRRAGTNGHISANRFRYVSVIENRLEELVGTRLWLLPEGGHAVAARFKITAPVSTIIEGWDSSLNI